MGRLCLAGKGWRGLAGKGWRGLAGKGWRSAEPGGKGAIELHRATAVGSDYHRSWAIWS